jgi:hypothetical protein
MKPAVVLTVFWATVLLGGLVYFLTVGAMRR